jgi:hypothetical protein
MTTRASKLESISQWAAIEARYPLSSPLDLVRQAAVMAFGNLVTARLVVRSELRPWELVFLVALEALVLSLIANIQVRFVPLSARLEKPQPLTQRIPVLLFGLVWLGFVYGIVLGAYVGDLQPFLAAARDPLGTLRTSPLRWPFAIALLGAFADAVVDWRHWRARGGPFLSTPGFNAGARWLTLFLGGIPFFVPIAGIGWAIATLVQRIERRKTGPAGSLGLQALLIPALAIGVFGTMGWLIHAGVLGWAIGYCSAKAASEALILFLPLIAHRAGREERAALDAHSSHSK